jgi:flavin-binding protein dodecin
MAIPRGRADKAIVDGINTALEAIENLDVPEVLDDAGIAALVADEESALYAALVALIAAETT